MSFFIRRLKIKCAMFFKMLVVLPRTVNVFVLRNLLYMHRQCLISLSPVIKLKWVIDYSDWWLFFFF